MLREHRDLSEELSAVIKERLSLMILDMAVLELQRLVRTGKTSTARLARLALDLLDQREIQVVPASFGPRDVDLLLVIYALSGRDRIAVATADRLLRRLLTKNGLSSIFPKHVGLIASWT